MSSVLVIAASLDEQARAFYTGLIAEADSLVAVDGGLAACRWADTVPDYLVGDLDSARPEDIAWAEQGGTRLQRLDTHKDQTDLEVALVTAEGLSPAGCTATGVLGKRTDHELAAFGAFFAARSNAWTIREPYITAWPLLSPTTLNLSGEGAIVSILAWSAGATATTSGMEYPLEHETLQPFDPRGVSNVIVSVPAGVALHSGSALVLSPRLDFPPAIGYATSRVET